MDYLTEDEVLLLLIKAIRKCKGQRAFGRKFHLSAGYINNVLAKRDKIGPGILNVLGVEQIISYSYRQKDKTNGNSLSNNEPKCL